MGPTSLIPDLLSPPLTTLRRPAATSITTTTFSFSSAAFHRQCPCLLALSNRSAPGGSSRLPSGCVGFISRARRSLSVSATNDATLMANSTPPKEQEYSVGDFMTTKESLRVVKPSTTVDEALEMLVEYRITGFPVIDDDWNLVGVVSDYDLLALDSISGSGRTDTTGIFPEVDSSWKVFNEIQTLLTKTNGKVIGDVMSPVPVVVRETTNLEDAARLLLETRYRRLPVVNADGKLVGIITRGNVISAALQIKREIQTKCRSNPKLASGK